MTADHTPYDYTAQGIAEAWTRQKMEQRYDFQGAIERQGVKRAAQTMKEEIREGSGNVR